MEKRIVIGIDLGTTNSCVAVWEYGRPVVIRNGEGKSTTPSVVSYTPTGRKIGEPAKRQAAIYPKTTFSSVKRLIGLPYSAVTRALDQFSYSVKQGEGDSVLLYANGEFMPPEEISTCVLDSLKRTAEEYLGQSVTDAVVTVPAYFNDNQRRATQKAAEDAGLNVEILNEPTAAAMAYGHEHQQSGIIVVFDLGGGTFDISVLSCTRNFYEVSYTGGDPHLGGDDVDRVIVEWMKEYYSSQCSAPVTYGAAQEQRIREAAERAKIDLSGSEKTEVTIPFLFPESEPHHLVMKLSRDELVRRISPLIERCERICLDAMRNAHLEVSSIDQVLLVGGTTKMPCFRELAARVFRQAPSYSNEADEIVAMGAAIKGAELAGESQERILLDVTALSLGIAIRHGVYDEIIPANTSIPTRCTKRYYAASRDQPGVTIVVSQEMVLDGARQHIVIGTFDLMGITSPDGEAPAVDVTFDLDRSGLLTVTAQDVASQNRVSHDVRDIGLHTGNETAADHHTTNPKEPNR